MLVQRKVEVGEAVKKNGEQTTTKWKRERDCVKHKDKEQSDCQSGSKGCAKCSHATTSIGIALNS